MKKLPLFSSLIIFAFLIFPSESYPITKEISVILDQGATNATLSGTRMRLVDANGKDTILSGTNTIQKKSNGELLAWNELFKLPIKVISELPMKYNDKAFRGSFMIKNSPNGFKVSNIVDLELYLRGVIKPEMNPKWHVEALKAQCILARTFAVQACGKHGEDDLCSTYHCQVYKGIAAEDSAADRAIEETSGLILRWKGHPASVHYHSDSGGMVTSSKNVWGGETTYLKPKAEPYAYSGPNSVWESVITMSLIEAKLAGNGINIGTIDTITPLKRDETGRVLSMEIKGAMGGKVISGYAFRNLLGAEKLKSTLFEFGARSNYINEERGTISAVSILPKTEKRITSTVPEKIDLSDMPDDKEEKIIWLTKKNVFTTLELMEILSRPDDIDSYLEKGIARAEGRLPMPEQTISREKESMTEKNITQEMMYIPNLSMSSASGPTVRIFGRGSGHGVGLSQWGAKTMAEHGWSFKQILDYYFPGTTIGQ